MRPRHRRSTRRSLRALLYSTLALLAAVAGSYGAVRWARPARNVVVDFESLPPAREVASREGGSHSESGQFSVLTYSVAGLPDLAVPGGASARMPHIARRLTPYDLVLLQQDFSHHSLLEAGAQHRYQSVPQTRAAHLVNDGLNRFSRFPFVPLTRIGWTQAHGLLESLAASKGFSVAETTVADGVHVQVYNLSADVGSTKRDAAARQAQLEQLANHIATQSRNDPLIVAGATRLNPEDARDQRHLAAFLVRTGLRDACEAASCPSPFGDTVFYRSGAEVTLEPVSWELAPEFGLPPKGLSEHPAVHVSLRWEKGADGSNLAGLP